MGLGGKVEVRQSVCWSEVVGGGAWLRFVIYIDIATRARAN